MKEPELVNASQAELDELLTLAKTSFPDKQYKLLSGVLGTFVFVMLKMQNAKTSIKRLQQMLFGARTEHKRNLALGPEPSSASALPVTADSAVVDGQGDPAGQAALCHRASPSQGTAATARRRTAVG